MKSTKAMDSMVKSKKAISWPNKNKLIHLVLMEAILASMLCACTFGGQQAQSKGDAKTDNQGSVEQIQDSDKDVEQLQTASNPDNGNQEIVSNGDGESRNPLPEEKFKAVLSGDEDFEFMNGEPLESTTVNIGDIAEVLSPGADFTSEVGGFAVVDMDGDGTYEIILRIMTNGNEQGFAVLHYQNGDVYGYRFFSREFEDLKEDGTFFASDSAFNSEIRTVTFTDGACVVNTLYKRDLKDGTKDEFDFFENGNSCTEEEFNEAFTLFSEKPSAEWFDLTEDNINLKLDKMVV